MPTNLVVVATSALKPEGNSGTTAYTFTVNRTGTVTGATTVDYAVTGTGTSQASAADFNGGVLPTGSVSFAAGETSKLITVLVAGDTVGEANETFALTLSNAVGGTVTGAPAQGTIQNDDPALFSIATTTASKAEGNSGASQFSFTVTRTGDVSAANSVTYAVAGSGATPASAADFSGGILPTGVLAFSAGQTSRTVTVNVVGDTVPEANEDFTVTLSAPTGTATIGTASATSTIVNDDATLAIAATSSVNPEGNSGMTPFTFTVTRSGNVAGASSARYAVTGSGTSPAAATDFGTVLPSGTVSFAAGETVKVITINVAGDTLAENDEGFTVTLSSPTGATVTTATATGTIQSDDTTVSIAATSASKAEGNSGTTPFTFTVTRSGIASLGSTVDYAVTGSGTKAADGADFGGGTLPAGTITFAAGEIAKVITVDVANDGLNEPTEGFTVTLTGATGATIGTATATGSILNDDTAISIATTPVSKPEGNAATNAYTFTVTRSGVTTVASTVDWTVAGSGTNGADASDFVGGSLPGGTISFAAGQISKTITVNVAGDAFREMDETFQVTLANPTGGTIVNAIAEGTIKNDDVVKMSIVATKASQVEGDSSGGDLIFTVTRTGDTSTGERVDYAVTGTGTAPTDGSDFGGQLPSGTIEFQAGETTQVITVHVTDDTLREPDETFQVKLLNPAFGTTITTAAATGTIKNDDATNLEITAVDAVHAEGDSGPSEYTFTVTRTGDISAAGSVGYTVTGFGTSQANAADFGGALPSGTVSFAAGDSTRTFSILVVGDTTREADESFQVKLGKASAGLTIIGATATGTIENDDSTKIDVPTANAVQTDGTGGPITFTFTVARSGDIGVASTVFYALSPGGAAPAADGSMPSGMLSFAVGEITKSIQTTISGLVSLQFADSFDVTLSKASTGSEILHETKNGSILVHDDKSITIVATNADQFEGTTIGNSFLFTVIRTGNLSAESSVNYSVAGFGLKPADATDFVDATLPSGTITFGIGQGARTIVLQAAADSVLEADENFIVKLSDPAGGETFVSATAIGTIFNDDRSIMSVATIDSTVSEGNADTREAHFAVTRTGDLSQEITVSYTVTGTGTAAANAGDFGGRLPSGTVTLAAGEDSATLTILISGDTTSESNETFQVNLTKATGVSVILTASAAATILDDDTPTTGDTIKTTSPGGDSVLVGTRGDDVFRGTDTGFDNVTENGARYGQNVFIRNDDGSVTVTGPNGTDTLFDVERVRFDDGVLLLNLSANAPAALRLYQAALGRIPDEGGLKVQAAAMDDGLDLLQLSRNFMGSAEFRARYGDNPSDAAFVAALYRNVLGREGDAGGIAVQMDALSHGLERYVLLRNFSEAAENLARTAPLTVVGVFAIATDPLL